MVNPFKNESNQKKSSPKIEIALNFIWETPLKCIRTKKKLSLKLGLENTLENREVGNHF